jgi:hypothetical protein
MANRKESVGPRPPSERRDSDGSGPRNPAAIVFFTLIWFSNRVFDLCQLFYSIATSMELPVVFVRGFGQIGMKSNKAGITEIIFDLGANFKTHFFL